MRTFAAYLLDRGAVGPSDLDRATQRQALLGGDLGSHLLGTGSLDEAALLTILSDYHGLPAGPAGRLAPLAQEIEALLPVDAARRYAVFPVGLGPRELHVATDLPLPPGLAQELGARVGRPVRQVVVSSLRLREAFWRHGGQPLSSALRDTIEALDGPRAVEEGPSLLGKRGATQPPGKQPKSYRRMVETAGQKVAPADRSSSVSLLSAMVASRLGPANAEADPHVEAEESFEEVELLAAQAADGSDADSDLDAQPTVEASARPDAEPELPEPHVELEGQGPDTERDIGLAVQGSPPHQAEATQPSAEGSSAREAEPAAATPQAPVFVEWREVAGLLELDPARGEIHEALGQVDETAHPTEPPSAVEPAQGEPSPASAVASEAEAPDSIDVASLAADEPPAPSAAAPSSRSFRHRGPFPRVAAEVALETAASVGQVLDIFQRFARQYFDRTVLWTVQSRKAEIRQSYGMPPGFTSQELDLDVPSLLRQAHDAAQIVVDVPTGSGFDERLRTELGLAPNVTIVVVPIRVRQRVVALLHADDLDVDVDRDAVAEVAGFANLVGNALAALIVRRKRQIPF